MSFRKKGTMGPWWTMGNFGDFSSAWIMMKVDSQPVDCQSGNPWASSNNKTPIPTKKKIKERLNPAFVLRSSNSSHPGKRHKNDFLGMLPAGLLLGAAPNRWKMVCWRHRTDEMPWIPSNPPRCAQSYLGISRNSMAKKDGERRNISSPTQFLGM